MCKEFDSGCDCEDCRQEFSRRWRASQSSECLRATAANCDDGAVRAQLLKRADEQDARARRTIFVIVPSHEAGGVAEFFGPFPSKEAARQWVKEKMPTVADCTNDRGWTDWDSACICEPTSPAEAWQRVLDYTPTAG